MKQDSKANESKSECSNTVKVLRMLSRGMTLKTFNCDRGPIFQVTNLNRNRTQFRPSQIQYQPSPTARNGSLDIQHDKVSRT